MDSTKPEQKYSTRIQKGGALLEDMRLLVRSWHEDTTWENQVKAGLSSNLLGKETRARATDVFRRAFSHRFIKGDPPEAWKIVRPLEDRSVSLDVLKPIYYWITARSDRLLYDFASEFLLAHGTGSGLYVRVEEVARWITTKLSIHGHQWSETVTLKVARGLLAALRDFGILAGASKKRIAPVYLPIESFTCIAFMLSQLGGSGGSLINHPDWRLFLLAPSLIEKLFLEAHQSGLLRYDAAGNLYRIEFKVSTIEELADVIARRAN
jgi:hypothetical protein